MSQYNESQFDFEVNEERTTNSMITPDESYMIDDFDAKIEEQESSELRKPRVKQDDNLVKQLQDEVKSLKEEIQMIKDKQMEQFEDSEMFMDMTMTISNANIEL